MLESSQLIIDNRNQHIMVVGDFIKLVEAYAIPNYYCPVSKVLVLIFCFHYGIPMEIHMDQGKNFNMNYVFGYLDDADNITPPPICWNGGEVNRTCVRSGLASVENC